MENPKRLVTWCGIPIEEMTREQLIESLNWYATRYDELASGKNAEARALGLAAMFGLPPS